MNFTNFGIPNLFILNDWEIKKFLSVVLIIHTTLICLIFLESSGFEIPIIRPLVGFVYLTFIPGFLILRVLRIHNLESAESILYAVGLSLSSLMFLGLFANTVYPLLGISKPISLWPLTITIAIFVFILCILSYLRDRDFAKTCSINLDFILSPSTLFLSLIPFIAIFGTFLVNFYANNILLMFLIPLIGFLPILAILKFEKKLYPFAVFIMAISLLFHTSLISNYLWGWDIQLEYYFSKLVLTNGYWNSSLYGSINGMLAIVILAPMYSLLCDLDIVWIFKIVYPFFFSFVPLAMYCFIKKQTNEKVSFLSCCFFIFLAFFYSTMLQLARQQIAELFLALAIALLVNRELERKSKSFLLTLFGISIIVSHYGTAYLFMFICIANCLFTLLLNFPRLFGGNLSSKSYEFFIGPAFTIIFAVLTLMWYMFTAGSHPFETLLHSIQIITMEFLNPIESDAFHLIVRRTVSPLHDVLKVLHNITQFFVVLGIAELILVRKYTGKFNKEYSQLSVIFFGIWVLSVIIPYYGFDFTRVYHITLIVLSPYFVIGSLVFLEIFKKYLKGILKIQASQLPKVLSIFLLIFLLFNSGWVYEVAKDNPTSIALSKVDYPVFKDPEVIGASWLHNKRAGNVYADSYRWLLFIGFEGYPYDWFQNYKTQSSQLYIFLGDFNIRNCVLLEAYEIGPRISLREYVNVTNIVKNMNKIYDGKGSNVYLGA